RWSPFWARIAGTWTSTATAPRGFACRGPSRASRSCRGSWGGSMSPGGPRGSSTESGHGARGVRRSWAEPGVEKLPSILAVDHLVWTADTLRRGAVVRFSRTDELPAEAAPDRMGYERLGTRSHLSIPLHAGGPMLGVRSFGPGRWE